MDRFETLTAFTTIVDQGGFAAAARTLRVSPTAVTRGLADLEERLGVQLLHRTTRSVRLTEQGAIFLPRARQILSDLRDAERLVIGTVTEPQGTLTVTAPVVFGRSHVVPIVTELLKRHERLSINLLLFDRLVQIVEEGIDIAIRIGELNDSALHAVTLGQVRRVLVASPAYIEMNGLPKKISDLKSHHIIAFSGLSPNDEWRFGPDGRSAIQIKPRLIVNSADAGIAAAVQGAGIGRFLSYQVVDEIATQRLITVLDDWAPASAPVHLLFQASRAGSPSLRCFIDAATVYIRQAAL
jgi:DNA-binding transcriptional LysR family regulator